MINAHKASKEGYHCPEKGNHFHITFHGGTKEQATCPGCGANLAEHGIRVKSAKPSRRHPSKAA
jgi:transcription initiation factor IIE alpha subunit